MSVTKTCCWVNIALWNNMEWIFELNGNQTGPGIRLFSLLSSTKSRLHLLPSSDFGSASAQILPNPSMATIMKLLWSREQHEDVLEPKWTETAQVMSNCENQLGRFNCWLVFCIRVLTCNQQHRKQIKGCWTVSYQRGDCLKPIIGVFIVYDNHQKNYWFIDKLRNAHPRIWMMLQNKRTEECCRQALNVPDHSRLSPMRP